MFNRLFGDAKPLVPASNDQRVGILYWQAPGLAADSPATCRVTLRLEGANAPVAQTPLRAADVAVHGLRVHAFMLEQGRYRLELEINQARWSAEFEVPALRPLQLRVGQALQAHGTPIVFASACDAAHYPYAQDTLVPWFDRPDAEDVIARWRRSGEINEVEAAQLTQFCRDGYIIMESAFADELIDEINHEIDDAIQQRWQGYQYGSSQRLEQLHQDRPGLRALWLNQQARSMIERLFGSPARPCQTLTYVFGSQQDAHQDTIHLTPFPAGYMCGLWIALQDIQPDSGELVVYPGSHREPRLRMGQAGCPKVEGDWSTFGNTVVKQWGQTAARYEPLVYRPKRGTALIWHENLMHAGSVRRNQEIERRSVVIHYFSADVVAYYDSTGHPAMAAPEALLQAP